MKTPYKIMIILPLIFLLSTANTYGLSTNNTVANDNKVAFGVVEVVDASDILVLVNKENCLPRDYVPEDLRRVDLPSVRGKDNLRDVAASALEALFKGAKKDGHVLFAQSGYRSYDSQSRIFYGYVKKYGRTKTETFSAPPGMSEHQTGLVMDISSKGTNYTLIEKFGELPEGKWIKENSWKYGFIIRYPKGKTSITKYTYEPWHLRYVGLDAAEKIYRKEITLEEYLDSIKWKDETFAFLPDQIISGEPRVINA